MTDADLNRATLFLRSATLYDPPPPTTSVITIHWLSFFYGVLSTLGVVGIVVAYILWQLLRR